MQTPDEAAALLLGSWTYRSWLNNPAPVASDDPAEMGRSLIRLLFAEAVMNFTKITDGAIEGFLDMGEAGTLTFTGRIDAGPVVTLAFRGEGLDPTQPSKGWIYDYQGFLIPSWPNGVGQIPAFVGSVIRAVPHGNAKAGVVASFISVKRTGP